MADEGLAGEHGDTMGGRKVINISPDRTEKPPKEAKSSWTDKKRLAAIDIIDDAQDQNIDKTKASIKEAQAFLQKESGSEKK
jgi:hypothetical protein